MNKKLKEKMRSKAFYLIISLLAVFAIGTMTKAYIGSDKAPNVVVEGDYIEATKPVVDDTFGAFPGPDIYERMYFHEGFTGESSIVFSLTQVATTSTHNPAEAGYWCNNTGDTLMISNWWWEIETPNDGWGSNWTIGTTTDNVYDSFTSTTTGTLVSSGYISTSTIGIFSLGGYDTGAYSTGTGVGPPIASTTIGSYYLDQNPIFATSSPFALLPADCIVVNSDHSGATSSASYVAGGGESGYTPLVGKVHADAVYR